MGGGKQGRDGVWGLRLFPSLVSCGYGTIGLNATGDSCEKGSDPSMGEEGSTCPVKPGKEPGSRDVRELITKYNFTQKEA